MTSKVSINFFRTLATVVILSFANLPIFAQDAVSNTPILEAPEAIRPVSVYGQAAKKAGTLPSRRFTQLSGQPVPEIRLEKLDTGSIRRWQEADRQAAPTAQSPPCASPLLP